MDFREILELVGMVVGTAGLGLLFYFYFTNPKVKSAVDQGLKYLPMVLGFAKGFVKDKKGVFDAYDALVVTERLTVFFRETVTDPTNTNFLDVEEEAFAFLKRELDRYKNAGVRGVPDINDQVLRTNVKVVFEQIVRALSEDSAGNDS
jgi:putative transposon-encoded protein